MHKKWHHHFSLSLKNLILNNFEILLDFCFRAPTGNEVITYKDEVSKQPFGIAGLWKLFQYCIVNDD
jgi:hypothetical protein